MRSLREVVQSNAVLSDVMEGREKLTTDAAIIKYPNGFTIADFDIVNMRQNNGELKNVAVVAIGEENAFIFGGEVLTNVFTDFLSGEYGGDIEGARAAVRAEHLKIKLSKKMSRNGRPFTAVEVI